MYLRKIKRHKDGKTHSYWALVESYRTARGLVNGWWLTWAKWTLGSVEYPTGC